MDIVILLSCLVAAARILPAQDLDPATAWATIAAYTFRIFPLPDRSLFATPGVVYYRASGVDLKVGVITPGSEKVVRPTVIFIHGGGWVYYTKDYQIFLTLPYLARGMDVVNVDYRQSNQARAPAAVEDCRCALHWVVAHAKEYGLDTSKLVVAGESAGGHLALMTGMLDQKDGFDDGCAFTVGQKYVQEPVHVSAIVNFYGITDVAELLTPPNLKSFAVEWLADVPNRMDVARRVSPLTYIRTGLPPIITIHGTDDGAVPYEQAVRLHQGLDQAHVPNKLVTIPHGQHGVYPDEEKLRAQSEVFKFLEEHGVLTASH